MFSTSMDSWRKIWADSLNLSGFSVVTGAPDPRAAP